MDRRNFIRLTAGGRIAVVAAMGAGCSEQMPADAVAAHLWVALKHEITYRKPTFLGDDVIATVLLEKVQGARAFYDTVIRRGEEVVAEVKSSWCCLDAETLRPARLARDIVERFFQLGEGPLPATGLVERR